MIRRMMPMTDEIGADAPEELAGKGGSYEEDLEELTRIVDEIGREDTPVDLLETRVRRAATLIRSLRARLDATEATVRDVLADLESGGGEG